MICIDSSRCTTSLASRPGSAALFTPKAKGFVVPVKIKCPVSVFYTAHSLSLVCLIILLLGIFIILEYFRNGFPLFLQFLVFLSQVSAIVTDLICLKIECYILN